MKVTEHVELLLRQGRKPKELIELGFPKRVVTRVRRQLRGQKAEAPTNVTGGTVQRQTQMPEAPDRIASVEQKLKSLSHDMQKVDSLAKSLSEVSTITAIARQVGTEKRENCPHEEDGMCTLPRWSSKDEIPQGIGEPVQEQGDKPKWRIKPTSLYCAMCSASLEDRLLYLESDVSGNLLSGAKYRITCNGCGSKGYIATVIKCTKCGRETFWGWWPQK